MAQQKSTPAETPAVAAGAKISSPADGDHVSAQNFQANGTWSGSYSPTLYIRLDVDYSQMDPPGQLLTLDLTPALPDGTWVYPPSGSSNPTMPEPSGGQEVPLTASLNGVQGAGTDTKHIILY